MTRIRIEQTGMGCSNAGMKMIAMLLLMLTVSPVWAREPLNHETGPMEMSVRGADIKQVELDTQTGKLSFSVAGRRYFLPGNENGFEGVAVAKLGILGEMRRCDQLTMSVIPSEDQSQPWLIRTLVLKYDSLRP